jgi:cytochrome d ubiquinol oxidase subunit II
MDIHVLWAFVICFSAVMYVIFDGFDLGVGILLPFIRKEHQRDTMIDSITPVWDGNETWLVLLGVGLFAGFPKAYSLLLSSLYLPFILMIISLIWRGVAMEFRFVSVKRKTSWDIAFAGGSILAAFCQGIILGDLMEGVRQNEHAANIDTSFLFLDRFTILIGFTLVVSFALTGATWLNLKTSGSLQAQFKTFTRRLMVFLSLTLVFVIFGRFYFRIFTPRFGIFGIPRISSPSFLSWLAITLAIMGSIYYTTSLKRDWIPFFLNTLMTLFSALFIVSGFWPYIVPPDLTIFDAGAPVYGNRIILVCSLVIIPVILSYFIYSYVVFRGKVTGKDNYEPILNTADNLSEPETTKYPRQVKSKPIELSWIWRIIISIAGFIFFFVVLGFLGDAVALGAIFVFGAVFCFAWFRN